MKTEKEIENYKAEILAIGKFYEECRLKYYGLIYEPPVNLKRMPVDVILKCLRQGDVEEITDYIDAVMKKQSARDEWDDYRSATLDCYLNSFICMNRSFPGYKAKDAMIMWMNKYKKDGPKDFWFDDRMLFNSDCDPIKRALAAKADKPKQASKPEKRVKCTETAEQSEVKNLTAEEKAKVEEELKKSVMDYIVKNYGPVEQKITLKSSRDEKIELDDSEIVHEKFSEILSFVVENEPVYLVGPAGSGKNHICKQIAKAMKLPFYFSNAVTQEYKITGFTDANGIYHETQFYKAFKDGGIFMLDELDASIPEVLIILNAAIANRYFDFPAPIGYVEAHKDFRVIAAGNTWGYGADSAYVGRNQLDMASLDRFAVVNVTYSPAIEAKVCPDADLLAFLRAYRTSAEKSGIGAIVSYRAMGRMFAMNKRIKSRSELIDTCLCKGLCKDDLKHICEGIESGPYQKALKQLANSRKY